MIDAIEPLSLVLWGVFFLAAGMYPLGFMLGASCSPCCGGQCGDPPVEFNRCIRFVNTNTSAPQTTYAAGASVDMPLHGYSRAVTRPEQVGAVRVATKLEVSGGVWISQLARGMSVGEVRTGIYRIYYKSPTGVDVGTAARWSITVRGVAITGDDAAPTPIVFGEDANGKTVTIYSDNAPVQDSAHYGKLIPFPTVELSPSGEQLRSTLILQAEQIQDVFQAFANDNLYGIVSPKTTKSGWIMRAFDPGVGATFNGSGHPDENQWNYDTEAVLAFLSGDSTMPYNSGSTSDPTRPAYGAPPSTTWTMQVSDPTQFCGVSLCTSLGWYSGAMYGEAVSSTVTVQTAALPQTITSSSSDRATDYINLCYGQESPPVISMRLSPGSCQYSGSHTSCINYSSAIGYGKAGGYYVNRDGQGSGYRLSRQRGAPARYFYCGDLLWAIEHGPCRTTLTIPYLTWGNETYTLGGGDTSNSQNDWLCPTLSTASDFVGYYDNPSVDQAGKCHPIEATLTLNEDMRLGRGASGDNGEVFAGKIIAGDYVMDLVGGGWIYDTNCNQQVYGFNFPVQPVDVASYTRHFASLVRRREAWCRAWDSTGFPFVQGNCKYTMSRSTGAFSGLCGVSIGSSVGWANLPAFPGSVSFGQQTLPYATTVTPQTTTVDRSGGNVQLTFCCPDRTDTVSIQANAGRYARKFFVESSATAGRGATAYITQAGYDGSERLFDVIWLSGSTGYATFYLASEFPGRIFSSDSCPIVGQVSPSEQPEYEWSVTAKENWIVVGKTDDGLLTISIDNNVTPAFTQPIYYNFSERPARRANITITSSGTTKSWTIIQLKP